MKMPSRRFLLIFGTSCVVVGSMIVVLERTAHNSSWLPNWIERVKPTKRDRQFLTSTLAGPAERQSEDEMRKVPVTYPDFVERMKKFADPKQGWNTFPKTGPVQGWVNEAPTDTKVISVIQNGDGVTVYSHRHHKLSWLEKQIHSLRNFMGARE